MLPTDQRLFTDEQLWALECAHERIAYHAGKIRPRSPWAPAPAKDEPKSRVPYEVVFRKPTPGEASNFRAQANDDTKKARAQEMLAKATVIAVAVAPKDRKAPPVIVLYDESAGDHRTAAKGPREAFDRLLSDYPLIPEAAATELGALAGIVGEEVEKE